MSDIKDFKSIADEVMSGIKADEALKAKTLRSCKRKALPVKFIPAAAFAVVAAAIMIAVIFSPGGGSNIPNVMMASESPGISVSAQPATVEDASAALGSAFLEPGAGPEGFSMQGIDVISESGYVFVTIQFSDGVRSYLIIEEKTQMPLKFEGYEITDVNGTQGHLKSSVAGGITETEVHWIKDGVHYTIMGELSDNEALDIARSMK